LSLKAPPPGSAAGYPGWQKDSNRNSISPRFRRRELPRLIAIVLSLAAMSPDAGGGSELVGAAARLRFMAHGVRGRSPQQL